MCLACVEAGVTDRVAQLPGLISMLLTLNVGRWIRLGHWSLARPSTPYSSPEYRKFSSELQVVLSSVSGVHQVSSTE